ncbi:hypothetical protein GHT06_021628 [Daphnia sinensis]|uniref:Uncharacterized protein n=1 Tax=Daphnia sinensis TaxID=1820382 RepID=A0AAD5L1U2_9CRUS|nr:hypothetical protein GHT06_021628 [Daphnia sinensis]
MKALVESTPEKKKLDDIQKDWYNYAANFLVYVLLQYHVMITCNTKPATKLDWVWKICTLRTRSGSHQFNFKRYKCSIDFNFGLMTLRLLMRLNVSCDNLHKEVVISYLEKRYVL